jgi:hypothetical protein
MYTRFTSFVEYKLIFLILVYLKEKNRCKSYAVNAEFASILRSIITSSSMARLPARYRALALQSFIRLIGMMISRCTCVCVIIRVWYTGNTFYVCTCTLAGDRVTTLGALGGILPYLCHRIEQRERASTSPTDAKTDQSER